MSAASSLAGGAAHCDEPGCHQLDFLPFTCPKCRRTFCLDHRDSAHHRCTFDITAAKQMPHCPVCQQVVYVSAQESADAKVNAHILSRCTLHLMRDVQVEVKERRSQALRCDLVDGCSNRSAYSTVVCRKCHLQFCLTHRFPEQHKCSALTSATVARPTTTDKHAKGKALLEKAKREREEKEAQRAASTSSAASTAAPSRKPSAQPAPQRRAQSTTLQQIRAQMASVGSYIAETLTGSSPSTPIPTPTTSSSSPPPAPSPAMKKAATGDARVPVDERWYLYVDTAPLHPSRPPRPPPLPSVWVSRQWTVGRAVDGVCELVGVECENHVEGKRKMALGVERDAGADRLPPLRSPPAPPPPDPMRW